MLVLSRKAMESLLIGNNIVVTVVRICENKVQLGIEAPRDMSICRREVLQARKQDAPPEEDGQP